MERLGVPQDDRKILSVSGELSPSADVPYGPRASTKGRVEARSHVEKNDRTDLAEEVVTREQVDANYQRTTAEQKAKTNVWLKAQKVRPDGLRRTSANTTRE